MSVTIPEHWTAAQGIGFLYMTFAGIDGDVPESEITTIFTKLEEWPGIDCGPTVMEDVVNFWKDLSAEETIAAFVWILDYLKKTMPEEQRGAVLGDVLQIAAADGELHDNEATLLELVQKSLDVSL